MKSLGCLVAAALACAGPLKAQEAVAPASGPQALEGSPLAPGDRIRLAFWRDPELDGEYDIDTRGVSVLPILGERKVAGVPAGRLAEFLRAEYAEQLRNQEVEITLLRRVRILGHVRSPGLYFIDSTMTLGDGIALAGGAQSDGKLNDIRVIRNGAVIRSDLDAAVPVDVVVGSGDQIFVPQRSWISRNSAVVIGASISAVGFMLSQALF